MKIERNQRKWEQHLKNLQYQNERLERILKWNLQHPENEIYIDNSIENALFGYTFKNYSEKNKKKDIVLRFDRFHNIIPLINSKVDAFHRRRKYYDNNPTRRDHRRRKNYDKDPARLVRIKRRSMRSSSPPARPTPIISTVSTRSISTSLLPTRSISSPPTRSISKESLYTVSLSTTRNSEEESSSKEFSRIDSLKNIESDDHHKKFKYKNAQIQNISNSKNIVNATSKFERNNKKGIKNPNSVYGKNLIPRNWSPKNIIVAPATKSEQKWKSNKDVENISNYDSNGRLSKYRYRKVMRQTLNSENIVNQNFQVEDSPNYDIMYYKDKHGADLV
jgi:hypothetical protein